jgi:hypothetical protein
VLVPVDTPVGGFNQKQTRRESNTPKSPGNRTKPPATTQTCREESEGQGDVAWDPGPSAGKGDVCPDSPRPLRGGGGGEGGRRHAEE